MNQAEFDQAVAGLPLERSEFFRSVGSTNDVVAEWARDGARSICLAAADEQTRGRGRGGRRWFTPAGSALAFSLLLDLAPGFDPTYLGRVSGLGALAVCEALEKSYDLSPQIKWPNDVLLAGKKVCGILPEAHWSGERLQALILGIGINVASNSVPPQAALNFPATCIEEFIGKPISAADLLRVVLQRLLALKPGLNTAGFLTAWQDRLAYKGERVIVNSGEGQSLEAELVGLARDGGLKIQLQNGKTRVFQAGEIQVGPLVDTQSK
jgi:BirA family biotin operon repressor/biotin-[acetyl-CoA-carboxylase] ligase